MDIELSLGRENLRGFFDSHWRKVLLISYIVKDDIDGILFLCFKVYHGSSARCGRNFATSLCICSILPQNRLKEERKLIIRQGNSGSSGGVQ